MCNTHGGIIAPNVRNWASDIDEGTIQQAAKTGRLPILAGPVALMPDAHVGIGATVGSVVPTLGAIIPSAVGVDVGCGMAAMKTSLMKDDLDEARLKCLLQDLEKNVPAGVGNSHTQSTGFANSWFNNNPMPSTFDGKQRAKALTQFGTLGSGNHFVELSVDQDDCVWIVLHSGSRGIGNEIASNHIRSARADFANVVTGNYSLEDKDLAWLVQGTPAFEAYMFDIMWLQGYALGNREAMLKQFVKDVFSRFRKGANGRSKILEVVNCHHNYTAVEKHQVNGVSKEIFVTRKGAIRAQVGDKGIIPGSMGTDSFIVEGLGNTLSWNSCSHGAGRRLSRTAARNTLTGNSLKAKMAGRVWLDGRAASLVDEHPDAYKSIEDVMADQSDLVTMTHRLVALLNYKG